MRQPRRPAWRQGKVQTTGKLYPYRQDVTIWAWACRRWSAAAALVVIGSLLVRCAAVGPTSRMSADDLDAIVEQMASSLLDSDFLQDRTARSPPIRLVIDKVENLTSDVVTKAEQWMVMARLCRASGLVALGRKKNLQVQISSRRAELVSGAGYADVVGWQPPTHVMTATFRSMRRAAVHPEQGLTNLRQDSYHVVFQITDVKTRQIEWSGQFAFKRLARGLLID